jgi:hypothetical protein
MLSQDIVDVVIAAAKASGIKPAALLAVVEIESEGAPLEIDGKTPRLLFERHVFHRELTASQPAKLPAAVKLGLAIPKWSKKTQYKDQGSSAARLALLDRARGVDVECANRSCSWGLGQTMGFLAEELDYRSATDMVAKMVAGGVRAQVDMMVAEICSKQLVDELNTGKWRAFARSYNGPAYAENQYDIKLAGAYRRWERKLSALAEGKPMAAPRYASLSKDEVMAVQQQLQQLGHYSFDIDGKWGRLTTGGISSFQTFEGLPVTGDYDAATREALAQATAAPVSDARANTTVDDLRAAGSQTVKASDNGRLFAKVLLGLGFGGGAQQAGERGLLDDAQSAVDQVQALRPLVEGVRDVAGFLAANWWVGAVVVGGVIWWRFGQVIERRIADRVSGRHA